MVVAMMVKYLLRKLPSEVKLYFSVDLCSKMNKRGLNWLKLIAFIEILKCHHWHCRAQSLPKQF